MAPKYIIRAALNDETNDGWVWICGPATAELKSRTVVKIRRPGCCRGVYLEYVHRAPPFVRTPLRDAVANQRSRTA